MTSSGNDTGFRWPPRPVVFVELALQVPVDMENGEGIWTAELECKGAKWSCEYKFENNVLYGHVTCNRRYEEMSDRQMWKYTARNQFCLPEGLQTVLQEAKSVYCMRDGGVPPLAYREWVRDRGRLQAYADERGFCEVVVKIMDIENLLPVHLNTDDVILNKSQQTYLGRGGDAAVFKGEYKGVAVAIKEFHAREIGIGGKDYFLEELERFKKLHHPNIVELIGFVAAQERQLVLTLCTNGALHKYVHDQTKEIGWRRFDNWVTDIIEGMTYLHSQDVTHRDLKTANVLIEADWSLKITDFARSKIGSISNMFAVTSKVGTIGYMAPELLSKGDDGKNTRKVDVWSFGVVLWELCTRYAPYNGLSETDVILRVSERELKLPEPGVLPDEICMVIKQCLSFDAEDRPSFADIKDELWAEARRVLRNNAEDWPEIATECHKFAESFQYAPRPKYFYPPLLLGVANNTTIVGGSIETLKLSETPDLDWEYLSGTTSGYPLQPVPAPRQENPWDWKKPRGCYSIQIPFLNLKKT